MQNEFEKRVRQKMEELDFVPSSPVWEKIEVQIRNKKDRRRLILWLPLLALLLSGGLWWMQSNQKVSPGPLSNTNTKIGTSSTVSSPKSDGHVNALVPPSLNESSEPRVPNERLATNASISRIKEGGGKHQQKKNYSLSANGFEKNERAENIFPSEPNEDEVSPVRYMHGEKINLRVLPKFLTAPLIQVPISRSDLVASHPPISSVSAKKRKWKFGASSAIGISGSSNGLKFLGGDGSKSMNAAPVASLPRPPLVNYSYSTPVEQDLYFSAGAMASKDLNKRVRFTTGLLYQFYSTKTKVGVAVSNALFNTTASFNAQRTFVNTGGSMQDYYNKYHFIDLPFDLAYQVHKKIPLFFHGGLSLQQLLKTNALQFNAHSQLYYYDKSAFHHTQIFSELGLDYGIKIGKVQLLTGPAIQYSFTETEKDNNGHHLYSMAWSAKIFFEK
ncbi:MAG: hypothetical protein ACJ75B_07440 [Flavisolibacter sp.]